MKRLKIDFKSFNYFYLKLYNHDFCLRPQNLVSKIFQILDPKNLTFGFNFQYSLSILQQIWLIFLYFSLIILNFFPF